MKAIFFALLLACTAWAPLSAAEIKEIHENFVNAFNDREWDDVKSMLSDDAVFHRATGDTAFVGPQAIVDRWSTTIGAADEWNVKFARLDSSSQLVGKDGRVVERGDFAVTAGGDSSACYAGSFMMTWVPADEGNWKLQSFAWQDVETDASTCQ